MSAPAAGDVRDGRGATKLGAELVVLNPEAADVVFVEVQVQAQLLFLDAQAGDLLTVAVL